MQAVILAAGKGTRLQPLTLTKPKPLIEVVGKPILAHIIESLPDEIDEVIIVVNYLGDQIVEYFGDTYSGKSIRYLMQSDLAGTASALLTAKDVLKGRFLVIPADDLHGREGLEQALKHELCLLAAESETPERFGVLECDEKGYLKNIVEKPERPASRLVSTGTMVLDQRIFDYEAPVHENGERYLTDMIFALASRAPLKVEKHSFWFPIGYPEDIAAAEIHLTEKK